MNRLTRLLNSKKGASLIIVIVVFAVLSILGTTLLTVASFNQKNSILYHNQRQAYYTARSVAETFVEQMYNVTNCNNVLGMLTMGVPVTSETMKIDNMGSYHVVVELLRDVVGKREVKATVYATYGVSSPASSNVSVILKEGKGNRINPIEFMFFSQDGGINQVGNPSRETTIKGDVLSRGSLIMNNTKVTGNMLVIGAFNFLKNSEVRGAKNRLIVDASRAPGGGGGEIKIDSTCKIFGDFYTSSTDTGVYGLPDSMSGNYIARSAVTLPKLPSGLDDFSKNFGISLNELGVGNSVQPEFKPLGHNIIYNEISTSSVYLYNGVRYYSGRQEVYFPDGSAVRLFDGTVRPAWTDKTQPEPIGFVARPVGSGDTETRPDGTVINFATKTVTFNDGLTLDVGSGTIYASTFTYTMATNQVTNTVGDSGPLDDWSIRWNPDTSKYDCKLLSGGSTPLTTMHLMSLNNQLITKDSYIEFDGGYVNNSKLVVDTSVYNKDINLYVKNTGDITLKNVEIEIIGDHNVYIFMKHNQGLTCENGTKIGETSNDGVQLFLIGNGVDLFLKGDSHFKGIAYLFGMSNYVDEYSSSEKVHGSITAKRIDITNGNQYTYGEYFKEPDFNATLRLDMFYIYPPQPVGMIPWVPTYGD